MSSYSLLLELFLEKNKGTLCRMFLFFLILIHEFGENEGFSHHMV